MLFENILNLVVKPKLHKKFQNLSKNQIFESELDSDEKIDKLAPRITSITGIPIVIDYKNSNNKRSQRLISCKGLSIRANKTYLAAYCHQCSSFRTFRIDRIIEIFDPETGESLNPVEAYFSSFTIDEKSSSGLSWGLSVRDRANLIGFLNALVFIARCDKEYHPFERDQLETAIVGYWLRSEFKGSPDCDAIVKFADKLSPDGETFWIALHGIKEQPQLINHFKNCVGNIIAADGVIKSEEAYWGVEIEQFFR